MPLWQGIGFSFLLVFVVVMYLLFLKKAYKPVRFFVLGVFVSIYMISISAMQLKYGIPLTKDSQQETLEISGEIEEIQSVLFSPRYYYDGQAVHAQLVTIQGVQYYFMTSGNLAIGDSVTITFLPNSKFVIESTVIQD